MTSRTRTTLPLRGTIAGTELKLDHASQLAIEWARHWLKAGPGEMGVDPLASGVARRALAVYIQHLARPDLDPELEADAVRRACAASVPYPEDRQAAWKRLSDHQAGATFPSFSSVLHGPQYDPQWAADMEARADAFAAQITQARPARRTTTAS